MRTFLDAIRALIYATGFVLFWGWLALGVRRYDQSLGIEFPSWIASLGIVVMIAGGILALLCIATFVLRGHGTPAPFDPPQQFVIVGPYRYVRNPMYVGGFAVMLGMSIYLRSFSILVLSIVFCFVVSLFVRLYEEPHLREIFGTPYEQYCQSVPRWIPGMPGKSRRA
jgi:protein-S-isoprenylcysteine O-methyltransferase Ste14